MRGRSFPASLAGIAFLVACAGEGARTGAPASAPVCAPSAGPVVAQVAAPAAPEDAGPSREPSLPEEAIDLSGCAMPPLAVPKATGCAPFESRMIAGVESELRRRFKTSSPPNKVVVDFGCYAISGDIREIVLEGGNGHGGSLELTRLSRVAGSYLVRRIRWSEYHDTGLTLESSTVPVAALEPHLPRMGVALLARLHEIPVYVDGMGLGLSGTSSSYDYHSGLTLIDSAGRDLERHYSGYASDSAEELPMELATRGLRAVLAKATFQPSPATDADRAFFARQFLRIEKGPSPFWWVEERLVNMASLLGSRPLIPSLVAMAKKASSGVGEERRKKGAVAAIGAILAFDAEKLPLREVIRKAELACHK